MNKHTSISKEKRGEPEDPILELIRTGARALIEQVIESELSTLLDSHEQDRLPCGRRAVVRNGYLPERDLQTEVGPIVVRVPKVRSRTDEPVTFRSALVPPYVRKARSLEAALPWLYLKGISSGDMHDALQVLVGDSARGLSPSTLGRLKTVWSQDWQRSDLSRERWMYVWVDGIYSHLRGDHGKLCVLVGVKCR